LIFTKHLFYTTLSATWSQSWLWPWFHCVRNYHYQWQQHDWCWGQPWWWAILCQWYHKLHPWAGPFGGLYWNKVQ